MARLVGNLVESVDELHVLGSAGRAVVVRRCAVAEELVVLPEAFELKTKSWCLQARRIGLSLRDGVDARRLPLRMGMSKVLNLMRRGRSQFGKQRCDFAKQWACIVMSLVDRNRSFGHHRRLLGESRQRQTTTQGHQANCHKETACLFTHLFPPFFFSAAISAGT